MRAQLSLCIGLAAALGATTGCTEDEEVIDEGLVPTAVSVDPYLNPGGFLVDSAVTCGPAAGSMQSFVAAFIDQGPESAPIEFNLPASPATPCSDVASFRYVVVGHRYSAAIDAYELPANALRAGAFGCDPTGAAGSRQMCTADETGKLVPVKPRWTTTCGVSEQAVARLNADVKIGDCDPLTDQGTPGKTAISVNPSSALGSLTCVADVATLSVLPEDTSLPDVTNIACGEVPSPYDEGIEAGETYRFRIEGADAKGDVRWGASCFVIPKPGIVNAATCDPLTDRGTMTVTFQGLVECLEGDSIEVVVNADSPEPEGLLATLDCGQPATVLGVLAGDYELTVTMLDAEHNPVSKPSTCTEVTVPPGGTGTTNCPVPEPL